MRTTATWSDEVDEILAGDLTAAIGMPTARGGVVLATVAPIGLRDRDAGIVSFTTSLGFGRKLERIHADPRIAVSYHTREHGRTDRRGHVLVQGTASIRRPRDDDEAEQLRERAADHLGQVASGRFWDWWLTAYYDDRVLVDIAVERITVSAALELETTAVASPAPARSAPTQAPPKDPNTPRVPLRRVERSIGRNSDVLLGYTGADGMPIVVPLTRVERSGDSFVIGDAVGFPSGGRRAGLLAHSFHPGLVGLRTATHTGWLDVDATTARWTPHTRHAFAAPPNKTLLLLGNGAGARWGLRQATRSDLARRIDLPPRPRSGASGRSDR